METEEPPGPLLSNIEIAHKIASGEFVLRDNCKKGKVWLVFARIYNRNDELIHGYLCCKDCGRILTFNKTNSTSNLVKHRCYILKFVYKSAPQKLEVSNSSFENSVADFTNSYSNNMLTRLFTKCFIKSCRSYEILQDENFRGIFQELIAFGAKFGANIDTDKIIPDPMTVAKSINEIYEYCFARLYNEIAVAKETGFGLACHVGTNDFSKKNYFVLTIHFFNSGKIISRLLRLRSVKDENCLEQNISQQINNILKDYECEVATTALIVASGCGDIIKAQTVPCISTSLSDVLAKSMEEIPEISQLVADCRKLHRLLMSSQTAITPEKCFSTNRWLSVYKELELVASSWNYIETTVISKSEAQKPNINKRHLEAVLKTLQPFKEAIESLEEDGSATLHLVLVYLHNLKKFCEVNDAESRQYNFIKNAKNLLQQNLEKMFTDKVTILHKLALFLYPPANKLLQFNDPEKENIEAECVRLMLCYKIDTETNIKPEPDIVHDAVQSKRKKLFSDFVYSDTNKDPTELVREELQIYKLTRVIDSEHFDVFSWWEQQQQRFPRLYKLSHMVLSTPATTAAAQRIFASVRDLLCDRVSELCTNDNDKERISFVKFNSEPGELDFSVGS